ncbi:MAG: sarcosine oxidase, subunit alpha [Acidobacteriaceae bacterium]|jgi:glycine cleavage system aminomethyltransferase T|nr:sarcosine oxidase, subunit alpha [Acidobacteriaceae bacterium]
MERHSALHRCHLDAQAQLQPFYGWQLPAWYTEPSSELEQVRGSVGISDASYLTKLDVRGPFSVSLPARLWKLTPARTLITSPLPIDLLSSSSVTDVTSTYSAILLAGPRSRDVLHKLTTLNVSAAAMPESSARQTRLAHVNAIILRAEGFLILNTRDVAQHVWEALLHAGAHPFGMVAQQQWMGSTHEDA